MIARSTQGILLMLLAALSFSVMALMVKLLGGAIPVFQIVFFRGAVGFSILAGLSLARTGRLPPAHDKLRLTLRSFAGFVGLVLYVWAIGHIDLGLASGLNQTSPLWVAIFAMIFLGERPPLAVPALVVVSLVGVWLVIAPDLTRIDGNAVMGLGSGVSAAVAYVFIRRLRKTDSPQVIVLWFTGLSSAFAVPVMIIDGWVWPTALQWLVLVGTGLAGLTGQLLMTHAYKRAEASIVSPFVFGTTVASFVFGILFWEEVPSTQSLVGVAIVIAGAIGIGLASRLRNGPGQHDHGTPTTAPEGK